MHKIDTPNATPDGEFQDGNPALNQSGTLVDADWLNAVQRDLLGVYTAGDAVPVKGQNLLATAISTFTQKILDEALAPKVQVLAPYALNPLEFCLVGEALVGRSLATTTVTTGAVVTLQVAGTATGAPVQTGNTWNIGDRIFWDDTLRLMTPVAATGRVLAGLATLPGIVTTTVVSLRLTCSGEGPLA